MDQNEQILTNIGALRKKRSTLEDEIADVDSEIRNAIIAAFDAGLGRLEIMEASGLSQGRIYQIRRGTRL